MTRSFVDCMNWKSRLLWRILQLLYKSHMPTDTDTASETLDSKIEPLSEIDRLMKIKPGWDK